MAQRKAEPDRPLLVNSEGLINDKDYPFFNTDLLSTSFG